MAKVLPPDAVSTKASARPARAGARAFATFFVVMWVGAWPWGNVRVGFSRGLSAGANLVFARVSFAGGFNAELVSLPADSPRQPGDVVQADTKIALWTPGGDGAATLGISLRRDAYLPWLTFSALVLALPLATWRKLELLAAGTLIILAVAIGSAYVLVAHVLSQQLALAEGTWSSEAIGFLFERWLLPWGNRVIAPVLLVAGLGEVTKMLRKTSDGEQWSSLGPRRSEHGTWLNS